MTELSIFRRPGAWLPLAMSLAALATVALHLVIHGAAREADEGAAAHLFQFLVVGQLPVIWYFAATWLRRAPRPAAAVLLLQVLALAVAITPVWYLNL